MKIFISWSGNRSRAVAEVLKDWIKCVLQATNPWLSTRDIDRGAQWFAVISDQLKDTTVGIVCLTQENKNRPWVVFEAGALAKGLQTSRVCTLLIDLKHSELEYPLAGFNHSTLDKASMWELIRTLNSCLASALDDRTLEQVFSTYWPQLEAEVAEAVKSNQPIEKAEPRPEKDKLDEILESTRGLNQRLRRLEEHAEASAPSLGGFFNRNVELENGMVSGTFPDTYLKFLKSQWAKEPKSLTVALDEAAQGDGTGKKAGQK